MVVRLVVLLVFMSLPAFGADDPYLRVRVAVCLRKIGGTTADDALANYRRGIKAAPEARAAGFKGTDKP